MSAGDQRMAGFTLVETLVALLVLAIGLLGVAAMQIKATQSAQLAAQTGMANIAAQDARERLWAARVRGDNPSCPTPAAVNGSDWQHRWQPFLPELNASPVSALGDCRFVIEVRWRDRRLDPYLTRLEYRVRLPQELP